MSAHWFIDHSGSVISLVNYVPVVATIVTCVFSLVLARATLRQVEATDKGLALAREEFEREWSPELHIKLRRLSATDVEIVVTNLARASVLLQVLQFRNLSRGTNFDRCWATRRGRRSSTIPRSSVSLATSPARKNSTRCWPNRSPGT